MVTGVELHNPGEVLPSLDLVGRGSLWLILSFPLNYTLLKLCLQCLKCLPMYALNDLQSIPMNINI